MCFTIMACGHIPRCAFDVSDSGAVRFDIIVRMITECGLSIHDISRVELDKVFNLPRLNMALELGADLGLRMHGHASQKRRKTLILDAQAHRYDKTLSDISGMDIEVHRNSVAGVIRCVRDWLNINGQFTSRKVAAGAAAILADYQFFHSLAPDIAAGLRLDPHDDLPHRDYLRVVEIAQRAFQAIVGIYLRT